MASFCLVDAAGAAAPAGASGGFSGSWKLDAALTRTMTLDGAGNGSMAWQPRAGQGDGGPIEDCVPGGDDRVTCNWNATYFDHDKTIVRHGTLTMHVDGDTLYVTQCTIKAVDSEDWRVEAYPSSAEVCGPTRWSRVQADPNPR